MDKNLFKEYLDNYNKFDDAIDRISKTIIGKPHGEIYLFDSDWYEAVSNMFDIFIKTHFTETGVELINAYMFENLGGRKLLIYEKDPFEGKREIIIDNVDKLWNYLKSNNYIL